MKKLIAVCIVLMLLSLTACGGNSKKAEVVQKETVSSGAVDVQSAQKEEPAREEEPTQMHSEVTLEALMNAESTPEDQFTYSGSEGDQFWIDSYTGTNPILVIPAERRSTPVTSVSTYALGYGVDVEAVRFNDNMQEVAKMVCSTNESLKIVVLGAGTQKIDESAFMQCTALETVVLNDGLLEIGMSAFAGCVNLKEITIPSSVNSIDFSAFWACHEDFTICGEAGSYAETYAAENGIPFAAK